MIFFHGPITAPQIVRPHRGPASDFFRNDNEAASRPDSSADSRLVDFTTSQVNRISRSSRLHRESMGHYWNDEKGNPIAIK
ncbi:MAG: hypothetical protein CMF59_09795 [Leptospiraceae bacterium]|nr:hypothetical protein [Leptospiraceae bacterium]